MVSTIKDRFNQPDYHIYANLEKMLLNGAMNKDIDDTLVLLREHYENDFDFPQLKIQLDILSSSFKDGSSDLNLMDIVRHLQNLSYAQHLLLSQVFKLAQYCLVMPASNAMSKPAFSAMR